MVLCEQCSWHRQSLILPVTLEVQVVHNQGIKRCTDCPGALVVNPVQERSSGLSGVVLKVGAPTDAFS